MARTGRFGRLPRAAPNLSSLIISLAREMEAQTDRNIVDAWKNGGEVDGVKVTDQVLLDHWRKRRDARDRSDPEWDQFNTLLQNYEFAIADSKMTLKYANHEVNETQMANHYAAWANKLPKDSEAYRELMRSAAQFRDAANDRARAGGAAARASAFKRGEENIKNAKMRPYEDASNLMLQAAIRYGIIPDNMLGEAPTLFHMRINEGDQGRFLELFEVIQNDPAYADIRAGLARSGIDPASFTYQTWLSLGQNFGQGLDQLGQNAANFGESEWVAKYKDDKTQFTAGQMWMGDIDEMAAYYEARRDLNRVATDPSSSPYEQDAAMDRYQRIIENMMNDTDSDSFRSGLENELRGLNGDTESIGPTPWEGAVAVTPEGESESPPDQISTAAQRNLNNSTMEAISSGRAVMHREVNKPGGETDPTWHVLPVDQGMADPRKGMIIWTDMGAGRSAPRWVDFKPIFSEGARNIDPASGREIESPAALGSQTIGQTFVLDGVRHYGVYDGQGNVIWSPDNPFRAPPGGKIEDQFADEQGYHVIWELPPVGSPSTGGGGTTNAYPQGAGEAVGGVTAGAGTGYRPKDIVPPVYFDDDMPNDRRWFNDPRGMMIGTDRRSATAALRADPSAAHALIMQVYGPGLVGLTAWNQWQQERNTLAADADQYFTPREIAMRSGDDLLSGFGVGRGRAQPDRLGTGEERYVTPEGVRVNEEQAIRNRAAEMVAATFHGTGQRGRSAAQEIEENRRRQLTIARGLSPYAPEGQISELERWVNEHGAQPPALLPPVARGILRSSPLGYNNPATPESFTIRPPAQPTIAAPPTIALPRIPPPAVHPVDLGETVPKPPKPKPTYPGGRPIEPHWQEY